MKPWTTCGVLLLTALLVFLPSCRPATEFPADDTPSVEKILAQLPRSAGEPPAEALERARRLARKLSVELKAELVRALDERGPAGAIEVCSKRAPEIARAASVEGASVRRVSMKTRNPADRPDPWEHDVLERLIELVAIDRQAVPDELAVVTEEQGRRELRYVKPIFVVKPCLACHGEESAIDPEVRATLARLYPADQAVGYAEGDLRGAVSVRVDLGQP